MNTHSDNVAAKPVGLTVEFRSADGTSAEYYQADEEHIRQTLRLLTTPRLLTQPQLVLASEHGVTVVPVRGIDIILARTSGHAPLIFPLIFPAGLLDITEVGEALPDDHFCEEVHDGDWRLGPLVSHVEVHTLGGWAVTLKILAATGSTVHDQRQWLAHFMNLPVVAFRLQEGGIGLINPNNIIHSAQVPPAPEQTRLRPFDICAARGGVWGIIAKLRRALKIEIPIGFQDETGFHRIAEKPPINQQMNL